MTQRSFLFGMCVLLQALDTEAARRSTCDKRGKVNIISLTDVSGYITLPEQTVNLSCTWIMTATEGYFVMLKTSYYALFENSSLEIRDGQNSSSKLLETYVGDGAKKESYTVISSGRHLWARFQCLNYENTDVFLATYQAVSDAAVGSCIKDKVVELNDTTGQIFSPLFPNDFPRGTVCTWLITAPAGLYVRLKLKDVELDMDCLHSALNIRDGKESSGPLLGRYCSRQADVTSVFSRGRYLWVNFTSKNEKDDYHASGFLAEYEAVKQVPASFSCTRRNRPLTLFSMSGNLASYMYPLPCDESIECIWRFMINADYKLQLSFDSFNLSSSEDCADDYVEIHRVKYCGAKAPATVTLEDGSDARVIFKSSGKGRYPGFKASYSSKRTTASILKTVAVCVGVLIALSIATFVCWKCIKTRGGG